MWREQGSDARLPNLGTLVLVTGKVEERETDARCGRIRLKLSPLTCLLAGGSPPTRWSESRGNSTTATSFVSPGTSPSQRGGETRLWGDLEEQRETQEERVHCRGSVETEPRKPSEVCARPTPHHITREQGSGRCPQEVGILFLVVSFFAEELDLRHIVDNPIHAQLLTCDGEIEYLYRGL